MLSSFGELSSYHPPFYTPASEMRSKNPFPPRFCDFVTHVLHVKCKRRFQYHEKRAQQLEITSDYRVHCSVFLVFTPSYASLKLYRKKGNLNVSKTQYCSINSKFVYAHTFRQTIKKGSLNGNILKLSSYAWWRC